MTEEKKGDGRVLNVQDIMTLIPHRYPFLLIDRVVDIIKGEQAIGIKNVTMTENFFQGHFPGHPIMPGVLIVEAMAQTGGVMVIDFVGEEYRGKPIYFMSIDECKFRKPVVPGDQVRLKVTKEKARSNIWRMKGEASVDGVLVAEAVLTAMIVTK